jgi:quinolinate synthase
MMKTADIKKRINELKKERNAVILAHVYQRKEVQDVADFVGDSLELSRKALNTEADVIVFCGVRFMAETAAVLNPEKTVLLPEKDAGCPLADAATTAQLSAKKKEYPDAAVVSYVNSSADVKARSDICCTSANAVDVVNSLKEKQVLFLPDKNLGSFVASKTGKDIILWPGHCYVHKNIKAEKIKELRRKHPNAVVIVHPECNPEVIRLADYVGSTSQMIKYTKSSRAREFIVGTEDGLIHALEKENPGKKFYPVNAVCKTMKLTTLKSVLSALEEMKYRVTVPKNVGAEAKKAIDKMLEIR